MDFKILPEKQKELAGATHADGTARFQTIFNKNDNPFIFDLLQYLDKKHHIKALINTSFNTKGQPIVHTISDAWNASEKMKLDGFVGNGRFKKINN
jgi:carbamoyltransferase